MLKQNHRLLLAMRGKSDLIQDRVVFLGYSLMRQKQWKNLHHCSFSLSVKFWTNSFCDSVSVLISQVQNILDYSLFHWYVIVMTWIVYKKFLSACSNDCHHFWYSLILFLDIVPVFLYFVIYRVQITLMNRKKKKAWINVVLTLHNFFFLLNWPEDDQGTVGAFGRWVIFRT